MKSFNTKIIALSNQKGGVGKTTSAVNIASFLAITETPVLLIDMDPQANASTAFGINQKISAKSIYDVMINNCNIRKYRKRREYRTNSLVRSPTIRIEIIKQQPFFF